MSEFWSWFTHSPIGLMFTQIPFLPFVLVRFPRIIAIDVSGLAAVGAYVLTAATLWFTVRQKF
ncbi:MAG TPA: hypothetical protein VGB18_00675 [Candidatus Thermoplasmatota archaeon]